MLNKSFLMYKVKHVIICLISLQLQILAASKIYNGFQSLDEPISARASAMGSAGTALDQSFSHYNPASMFNMNTSWANAQFGSSSGDFGINHIESAWKFNKGFLGLSATSLGTNFPTSNIQGVIENTSSLEKTSEASFTVGYLHDRFAIALITQGIEYRIHSSKSYALTGGAGFIYNVIPSRLNFGMSLYQLGKSTNLIDTVEKLNNEDIMPVGRLGLAWQDSVYNMPFTAAIDFVYRKRTNRYLVPIGFELQPTDYFYLRIGKRFGSDVEMFSTGLGIAFNKFKFDITVIPQKYISDYNFKWLTGITYSLSAKKNTQTTIKSVEKKKMDRKIFMEESVIPVENHDSLKTEKAEDSLQSKAQKDTSGLVRDSASVKKESNLPDSSLMSKNPASQALQDTLSKQLLNVNTPVVNPSKDTSSVKSSSSDSTISGIKLKEVGVTADTSATRNVILPDSLKQNKVQ